MRLLGDRFLVGCATLITLAVFGGILVLFETGHGDEGGRLIGLISSGIVSLVSFGGISYKVNQVHNRVSALETKQEGTKQTADSTQSVAQDTNSKVSELGNGKLKALVTQAVKDAIGDKE